MQCKSFSRLDLFDCKLHMSTAGTPSPSLDTLPPELIELICGILLHNRPVRAQLHDFFGGLCKVNRAWRAYGRQDGWWALLRPDGGYLEGSRTTLWVHGAHRRNWQLSSARLKSAIDAELRDEVVRATQNWSSWIEKANRSECAARMRRVRKLLQIGANADATVHQAALTGAVAIAGSSERHGMAGMHREVSLLQLAVRAGNTTLARALVGAGAQPIGAQGVIVSGRLVPKTYTVYYTFSDHNI